MRDAWAKFSPSVQEKKIRRTMVEFCALPAMNDVTLPSYASMLYSCATLTKPALPRQR